MSQPLQKHMPIYKSFLIFSSLIASIYYLRTYNSIPSQPKSNIDSPRLLGALKNKFCSDSEYDQPTSSDINKAIEFRSSFFENMRSNENLLKKAVRTSDWDEYVQSLISPTLVWIIFSAFSFIGWVFYCICCWFDKKCPPCPRLRRDTDIYPYEGFELWGLIFFIVILGTGIVAISIAGIIYSTKIEAGAQKVVCSLATIYDNIIYGSTFNETNWIGISNTPNMINSTLIELTNYPDKFFNSFNDTTWINTGIQNLLMANRNIYTKFKFSALSSPNPSYSSDVVSSNFIKNVK